MTIADLISKHKNMCLTDDEVHRLIAEIERLTENNRLFQRQNEENAQAYSEGCEVNRRQFESLYQAEKDRDKYKAALESLHTEALLCDAHGITLQFVQFVLSKTAALK